MRGKASGGYFDEDGNERPISTIIYCQHCGEYLGDRIKGVLYKVGQVVTEEHVCAGGLFSKNFPNAHEQGKLL